MAAKRKDGLPSKHAGGRPQGAATRLTRVRANEIAQSGESPLDVMYENMLFWHRASHAIAEKIAKLGKSFKDETERSDFLKLLQQFLEAREKSQSCAVDAAPYIHPKLSSIAFKGDLNGTMKHVVGTMSAVEAAEAWASTLKANKEQV